MGAPHGVCWVSSGFLLGARHGATGCPLFPRGVHGVPAAAPLGAYPASHWVPTAVPTDDISCLSGQCLNATRRPTVEEFERFLPWFLHDLPTLQCAKG